MEFLTTYGGTLCVGALILAIIGLIIFKMRRDKKKGKRSCGCNCSHCPSASAGCTPQHTEPHATPKQHH